MQTSADFSKQLIKGKIAELIFDQMFRRAGGFTIIPFGYETIIPEIKQYVDASNQRELLANVRNAPDFALIYHDARQVVLVEVKYRNAIDMVEIKKTAQEISAKWKQIGLFVVTPDGFYLDHCDEVEGLSELTPLSSELVPMSLQDEYKELAREFYRSHSHAHVVDDRHHHVSVPIKSA